MRSKIITIVSVLIFCLKGKSQQSNDNDMNVINSIFDRMELQGIDTKQNLLYGYFFFDKAKAKLEKLKNDLIAQSYKFVGIENTDDNKEFRLHVEKVEKHTRQSLRNRQQDLRKLAEKHKVSSFDGWDVGNTDPTIPLISDESFTKFMSSKKGDNLFDLGIKLYDLEINDKAELAFRECLKQGIKPDTSSYKLGNLLIGRGEIDDGIKMLEDATKINPDYLYAFFNLGATCYDNAKYQKSIQYYKEADKIKPNDGRIIYGIAASQYAMQQFDNSLEYCKKALLLNKENQNAKLLMQMLKGKTK